MNYLVTEKRQLEYGTENKTHEIWRVYCEIFPNCKSTATTMNAIDPEHRDRLVFQNNQQITGSNVNVFEDALPIDKEQVEMNCDTRETE